MFLSQKFKSVSSNLILLLFFGLLALGFLISEVFKQGNRLSQSGYKTKNPLSSEYRDGLTTITVKNSLGEFTIQKNTTLNSWRLVHPRELPANQTTVNSILEILRSLEVKKVFPKNPVNIANFSIDSPQLTLSLADKKGDSQILTIGLSNALTDSSYLSLSGRDFIFEVERLRSKLQKLDLANFIDSKVFSLPIEKLKKLVVTRFYPSQKTVTLYRNDEGWFGPGKAKLDTDRTLKLIKEIVSYRSHTILDQRSKNLDKALEKYHDRPLYEVLFEHENGEKKQFKISQVVSQLPDLRFDKKQFVVVYSDTRDFPYLVNKEILNKVQFSYRQIKALEFKKLFY